MKARMSIGVGILACTTAIGVNAQAGNPASDAVRDGWNSTKRTMLAAAKTMPDARYSFKPVDTVRSYGAILAHVAGANYVFCSAAKGEKTPYAEDHFEKTATTPAAIVKALQDSNAYCDTVYGTLTDANGAQIVMVFGGKQSRLSALMGNTNHNAEHYGNLVTYLRINGLVPPTSQPSK